MSQSKRLKINVLPNEILFPESKILIEVDTPLEPEFAQSAITIRDQIGQIQLSNGDRKASWVPKVALPTGHHTLIVGDLITKTGEKIPGAIEIPFFVTDSVAKVPSHLRVEHIIRFRIHKLKIERLPADHRPSGKFIEIIKASNRYTDELVELAFDENGKSINIKKIFADIKENHLQKYGNIHESLYTRIQKLGDNSSIEVAIWLRTPELSQESLKKLEKLPSKTPREVLNHRKIIKSETSMFMNKIAREFRIRKLEGDPVAPVVYVKLNKTQIRNIAKRPEVLAIFLHEIKGIDDLDDSIAIANSDDAHALGIKGAGVKVAVWEGGPDKIDDLKIEAFYDVSQTNKSAHARNTHCIIKNKELYKPKGHAPSCKLYSANDYSLDALRWAIKKKCNVISQSFHRSSEPASSNLSYDDIYKDWRILNYPFPTIIQAAGNFWDCDGDKDNPPGGTINEFVNHKGYNSLAVGNHNDLANAMSGSSVFRNPTTTHGDRELPEICANGDYVTACKISKSGTSMAAPAVAGIAALIQSKKETLKIWPEGCRAIILAGAKRNVRGNTWWQDVLSNVDSRDGSGAVDAYESVKIAGFQRYRNAAATRRGWDVGTLRSRDFGSNRNSTFCYRVKIPKHWFGPRHVKVALAWDSKVGEIWGFPLTSKLTVDLDLRIYDKDGNVVGYSGSYDNSYEIAEFKGERGQTYTIRIRRWSGTDNTWYGIAWTVTGGISLVEAIIGRQLLLEDIRRRSSVRRRGGFTIG